MATADVVVVGLGAIGSAVACALARRGARVVGIDRFHPPHEHGSSHGRTRITRLAVGEGAAYVPLVQRSHVLWRELEAETGLALMRRTGVLLLASPAAAAGAFHSQVGFFERTVGLARSFAIAHELLTARDVRERFPAFMPRDDERAYLEPDGGVLFPEHCIRAQWRIAAAHGAELRTGEPMVDLSSRPGGVAVRTDRCTVHAARAVLCTGAWLPGQVGGALQSHLRVLRQTLHWLATDTPQVYDAKRCPAYIWLHGPTIDDAFYGFPLVDDVAGVKVAMEQLRDTSDPDGEARASDPVTTFERHVRGRLAGLRPHAVETATCLYTMAPDGKFVVDSHPRHEAVTIVSPCSGHGFKHSAGLGEAIAQHLLGETPHAPLDAFALRL